MKKLVFIALAGFLSACDSKPERSAQSTNPEVSVNVLARFEGIVLYRVEADGKQIYVAKSTEEGLLPVSARWTTTYQCSKHVCTKHNELTTVPVQP